MKRCWVPVLAVLLLCPMMAGAATMDDLSDAPVIRRPLEWRKGRFGLSPVIGITVTDPYWRTMTVGASADYHILEWLAVGVDFRYGVGFTTDLLDTIESGLADARGSGEEEGVADVVTVSRIDWIVDANVQLLPLYGKFVAFDALEVAYDLHVILGFGYAGTVTYPEDRPPRQVASSTDGSIAPLFGVGARLFLNRWLAINIEFRDYLISMLRAVPEYPKGASVPGKSFEHNLELSLGVTFFLPTEIDSAKD